MTKATKAQKPLENPPAPRTKRKYASVRVSELMGNVAGAALRRQGFAQLEIIARWPEIVGAVMARYSAPERISFPKDGASGGTLYIRSDSAFALELQHSEPLVIERINSYYGFPAVARLAIRQGPLPMPKKRHIFKARPLSPAERSELSESLQKTADESLKQALENLGQTILGDGPATQQNPNSRKAEYAPKPSGP